MLTNFDIRSCGLDYLDRLTPDSLSGHALKRCPKNL
jgi:hypothetical protein